MNANRNQRVALYRGGKLDHVVREGNEPEYVKKFSGKRVVRRKGTPWFAK